MIKTLFFGTPKFAKIILAHLLNSSKLHSEIEIVGIVTKLPDKKYNQENNPVFEFAKELGLNVFTPQKINVELPEILNQTKPELIIVCAYGKILPKFVLDFPKFCALNIHASLLPTLRGATPIESAILQGLEKTGTTLQVMSEKMDEGNIIGQLKLNVNTLDNLNATELKNELANLSCELLDKFLLDYLKGKIIPISQVGTPTYCFTKDFTFENAELKFDNVESIDHKVRAFSEIGAWIKNIGIIDIQSEKKYLFEKLIKINKVNLNFKINDEFGLGNLNEDNFQDLSLVIFERRLFLKGKSGIIEVLELTPEGKNKQISTEFINGVWNKLK